MKDMMHQAPNLPVRKVQVTVHPDGNQKVILVLIFMDVV
jgi:hypothetical protein